MILCSCIKNDQKPILSSNNGIAIWDVDPIFEYDDIEPIMDDLTWYTRNVGYENDYEYYGEYDKGAIKTIKYDHYGIIDKNGEIKIPNIWDGMKFIYFLDIKNFTGGFMQHDYSYNKEFVDGICGPLYFHYYCYNNKIFRNLDSKIIELSELGVTNDEMIILEGLENEKFYRASSKGIEAIDGIPNGLNLLAYENNILFLEKRDNNNFYYVFYDNNGKQIGETYINAYGFQEGLAPVSNKDKWGYIDTNGKLVIDYIFDKATPLYDGKVWVIYEGRTGKLNIQNMLDNNISFTKDILDVTKYEIYKDDGQYIELLTNNMLRDGPSTSANHFGPRGNIKKGEYAYVYEKMENEGQTWYKIYDSDRMDLWILDYNNEWVKELE